MMNSASPRNWFLRQITRPNAVIVEAQPRARRRSSSDLESFRSEQLRRDGLKTVTQPRQRRRSFQQPSDSEQPRKYNLETGTQPKPQRRRSFQGPFNSDAQRKQSLELISEARKKAAAWAWYQHGRGPVEPTKMVNRPGSCTEAGKNRRTSRFKAEAMNVSRGATGASNNSLWDCESHLYDSVELQSLSEQLHRVLGEGSSRRSEGPSLHQASIGSTKSMPQQVSSFTVPVDAQYASASVSDNRNEYENVYNHGNKLEEKTKKSTVVGRSFEIISKALQKITRSRHARGEARPDKEESRNQHQVHHYHHHFFYHHYGDTKGAHPEEVPVPMAPSTKTLEDWPAGL